MGGFLRVVAYDCFISYASPDVHVAHEVCKRLSEVGLSVWFDRVRLKPAYDWYQEIERGCEESRVVIPILTPHWKVSQWTRFETYGAESVLPLLADGNWEDVVTPPLRRYQTLTVKLGIETSTWQTLLGAIREQLAKPVPDKVSRLAHLNFRPNPFFVGREEVLNQIHEKFHQSPTAALTQGRALAVTALGGVGKTSIAREYAERFWRCYRQVLWVECRNNLESEFARLLEIVTGEAIDPCLKQAGRAEQTREELNRATSGAYRLLIFDNAENEDSVRHWIPTVGNCHTMITSRFTTWSPGVDILPVEVLEMGSARQLLLLRAGRDATDSELGATEELARKLGYLPLALEQAGSYVAKQGRAYRFADYLELYAKAEKELLAKGSRGSTEYPDAVYSTWQATINRLPSGSRAILRLSAFLAPMRIPFRMFLAGTEVMAQQTAEIEGRVAAEGGVQDEFAMREFKDALVDYSMVTQQADDTFLVHPLVQAVERNHVDASARPRWIEQAMRLISNYGPEPSSDYENWSEWKILEPHGRALWRQVDVVGHSDWAASLFDQLASFLKSQGDYVAAESLYRWSLEVRRLALSVDNPKSLADILPPANNLALLLCEKGDCDSAEQMMRCVMEAMEFGLGPESPSTLQAVANMALVLNHKGDLDAAEKLSFRAMEARKRLLGPEHPDTLTSISNLAALLQTKGDLDAAEKLSFRAMEARKRALGPEHPSTLTSISNLALVLQKRGDTAAAEMLFRQVLEARERVLGENHPDSILSMQRLAVLLHNTGAVSEAKSLSGRALDRHEKAVEQVRLPSSPVATEDQLDEEWETERQRRQRELSKALVEQWSTHRTVGGDVEETEPIKKLRSALTDWSSQRPPGFESRQVRRQEKQQAETRKAIEMWQLRTRK